MKKGIVIPSSLSHKNLKHIFSDGDLVTENDVNNFDLHVKKGNIKMTAETVAMIAADEKKAKKIKSDLNKANQLFTKAKKINN